MQLPTFTLHLGDCLESLRAMPDNSVDSIVSDPPYGLSDHKPADVVACLTAWLSGEPYLTSKRGFMGKTWDSWVPGPEVWRECLRVLKPGGHVLAFSGSRTHDLMSMAMRLAGFECRDTIMYLYGSGFPKSMDVSKAIDKAAGMQREVVGYSDRKASLGSGGRYGDSNFSEAPAITEPATEASQQWQGWGTALKPAFEPVLMFRKPLSEGTVSANVLKWGTGAININDCRIQNESCGEGGSSETNRRGSSTHDLRSVRQADDEMGFTSCEGQAPDDVQRGMSLSGNDWGWQSSVEGGGVDGRTGELPLPAHRCIERGGQGSVVKPECASGSGTSVGYGAHTGASTAINGDGPPHQRREGRQPAGEFASDELGGTLERAPTAGAGSGGTTCGGATPAGATGRWPANLIHDGSEEVLAGFPATTSGKAAAGGHKRSSSLHDTEAGWGMRHDAEAGRLYGDAGSAARFFYCAKASKRDRDEGLDAFEAKTHKGYAGATISGRTMVDGEWVNTENERQPRANIHPTVKPTDLMAYLVRLVTPPGGLVLDPFMGSGSTGKAAMREGFRFIGCELSPEYLAIAEARIAHELAKRQRPEPPPPPQSDLFAA